MAKVFILLILCGFFLFANEYKARKTIEFSSNKNKYVVMVNNIRKEEYDLVGNYKYFHSMYECLESKEYEKGMKTSYPAAQRYFVYLLKMLLLL